ncbi:ABC-type transport system involved in multi-copper enzyme maturation permease subunit [Catenulispora sp. GP43]|uniref:ABC transporter permease n=1 Tax=Catenulispora sp. GP43 TaxID=3156263 RepID=UPI0035112B09
MTTAMTESTTAPSVRAAGPTLRALAWVTWRQHRTAFIGLTAVFVFCGLLLLQNGLKMHTDFRRLGLADCLPGHQDPACPAGIDAFHHDQDLVTRLTAAFFTLPVLFGMFLGAPLTAREFESGTYRFAFTQGVGRTRWLATKISLVVAFTLVSACGFAAVVIWWYGPLVAPRGRLAASSLTYEIYGTVFVGRALFALALGIFAGALVRRVVPAIAVTLTGWIAVFLVTFVSLRSHFLTPLTAVDTMAPGNNPWVIAEQWTAPGGRVLSHAEAFTLQSKSAAAGHTQDLRTYLAQQGYSYRAAYFPESRFWTFQTIETSGLVVLSLMLLTATVWLVRRRAA